MRGRFLALAVLLVAGCGGGDKPKNDAASVKADKQEARAVAQAYLIAVGKRNWKAVCATRSKSEVAQLAQTGGSCEKVFATLLAKQPVQLFSTARAGEVRIKDDVAGIDVIQRGQKKKFLTLAAVREDDGWKLEDMPDEQVP